MFEAREQMMMQINEARFKTTMRMTMWINVGENVVKLSVMTKRTSRHTRVYTICSKI